MLILKQIAEIQYGISNREFRVLMTMALHSRNNPPEYQYGRDFLAEALGLTPGTEATNKVLQRNISSLVNKGFLRREALAGPHGYAAYRILPSKGVQTVDTL